MRKNDREYLFEVIERLIKLELEETFSRDVLKKWISYLKRGSIFICPCDINVNFQCFYEHIELCTTCPRTKLYGNIRRLAMKNKKNGSNLKYFLIRKYLVKELEEKVLEEK